MERHLLACSMARERRKLIDHDRTNPEGRTLAKLGHGQMKSTRSESLVSTGEGKWEATLGCGKDGGRGRTEGTCPPTRESFPVANDLQL